MREFNEARPHQAENGASRASRPRCRAFLGIQPGIESMLASRKIPPGPPQRWRAMTSTAAMTSNGQPTVRQMQVETYTDSTMASVCSKKRSPHPHRWAWGNTFPEVHLRPGQRRVRGSGGRAVGLYAAARPRPAINAGLSWRRPTNNGSSSAKATRRWRFGRESDPCQPGILAPRRGQAVHDVLTRSNSAGSHVKKITDLVRTAHRLRPRSERDMADVHFARANDDHPGPGPA